MAHAAMRGSVASSKCQMQISITAAACIYCSVTANICLVHYLDYQMDPSALKSLSFLANLQETAVSTSVYAYMQSTYFLEYFHGGMSIYSKV